MINKAHYKVDAVLLVADMVAAVAAAIGVDLVVAIANSTL